MQDVSKDNTHPGDQLSLGHSGQLELTCAALLCCGPKDGRYVSVCVLVGLQKNLSTHHSKSAAPVRRNEEEEESDLALKKTTGY